jgi:hypothetical protein
VELEAVAVVDDGVAGELDFGEGIGDEFVLLVEPNTRDLGQADRVAELSGETVGG